MISHTYYTYLDSAKFEHFVCLGSLMITVHKITCRMFIFTSEVTKAVSTLKEIM